MEKRMIALIGDVVSSRKILDRIDFDARLLKHIKGLGEKNETILSPYTLIGDEIQAVYERADWLFHDAVSILAEIYPQKMRFSYGIGSLVKPINPDRAIEMDGPAFHNARDGITEIKKEGYLLDIVGENDPNLKLTRSTLFFLSFHMKKWNKTRFQTLALLLEGLTIKQIALRLGLEENTIYKTRKDGALELVIDLIREIQVNINQSL